MVLVLVDDRMDLQTIFKKSRQDRRIEYCAQCQRPFGAPIGLALHVKVHDRGGYKRKYIKQPHLKKQFTYCIFCRDVFTFPSGIVSHLARHHHIRWIPTLCGISNS